VPIIDVYASDGTFEDKHTLARGPARAVSYLGIDSEAQPDGSLRAVEITVFPEAMRGTRRWRSP
jgi:hypothetical protein